MWNGRKLAQLALESYPNRADNYLLAAKLAYRANEAAEAAKLYRHAVDLEPGNLAVVEAQLGYLLRQSDSTAAKKRIEQLYNDPRLPGDSFLGMIDTVSATLRIVRDFEMCMTWVEPLVKKSGVSLLWLAHRTGGKNAPGIVSRAAVFVMGTGRMKGRRVQKVP